MNASLLYSGIILLLNFFLVESTIYFVDGYLKSMIEMTDNNQPCKEHTDPLVIQNVLQKTDPRNIQRIPSPMLNEISKTCAVTSQSNETVGFIFPGTKWCGLGTRANGYDDLGIYTEEDRCCREHDHCPISLKSGQCRNGICNTSPYTRSHCDCDEGFKKCLFNVNSHTANIIGSIFFNVIQVTCFRERRSCPESMRDNLSYSWWCEEWKFVPLDTFIPAPVERKNQTYHINEIPEEKRPKLERASKIDADLETIFGKEDDIAKIMKDYRTIRN